MMTLLFFYICQALGLSLVLCSYGILNEYLAFKLDHMKWSLYMSKEIFNKDAVKLNISCNTVRYELNLTLTQKQYDKKTQKIRREKSKSLGRIRSQGSRATAKDAVLNTIENNLTVCLR